MANQKITDLTELTTPDSADLIEVVDDVAGTPVNKKMTLAQIMPTGGTENQVLAKSGAGYGALKWYTLPQQSDIAFFEQSAAVTFSASAGGVVIPLGETMNDIAGCSLSTNILTIPAGTYFINAMVGGFKYTGTSVLLLWDEDADSVQQIGPFANFNDVKIASALGSGIVTLQTVLVVASETDYTLRAQVQAGRTQNSTYLTGLSASFGSLSILKIK